MENKRKIWGLSALALTGLFLALKLVYIYFAVNFLHSTEPSFCVLNDIVDCDAVAKTDTAVFLGIPLALYGVFLYCFVLFLCFVDKLQNIKCLSILKVFKNPTSYICTLYTISFAVSIFLLLVQFFLIQKFCLLCCLTYIIDLVSLLYAMNYADFQKRIQKSFKEHLVLTIIFILFVLLKEFIITLYKEFKVSVMDFIDAIKVKTNLVAFLIVVIMASGVVCYANTSHILTPQFERYYKLKVFDDMKNNPFKVHGNVLGDENAKVVITEYSDFECPMCKIMNKMLQKAGTEYDNVLIIHRNYPLDMACNPIVTKPFHMNSCKYAKFALAAKEQNKYWEMINILFDYKPKNNNKILKLAQKNGINDFQLVNDYISVKVENEMIMDINSGLQRRIDATPTIFINEEKIIGIKDYEELQKIIEAKGAILKSKEK